MNLSRRSFIFGGSAAAVGAGLALSGCNHRIGGEAMDQSDAIRVTMVDYFDKFDFIGAANPTIVSIGWHILEGLYDNNPLTNEIYPAIATDFPTKIDDLTYEITLRDNAKFSNDAKVMAGDIINSFSSAKNKASVSYLLEFLDTIESAGNNKVRLKLNYPADGVLLQRLSLVKIMPAMGSDVDKQSKPIGTGPYQIAAINGSVGGETTLMPNSNYNGKIPLPKNPLVWVIPGDSDSRAGSIISKDSQICEDLPLDEIKDATDAGITIDYKEGFENANFFFNTRNEVFANRGLRQAVYYAINTDRLINDKMAGHASPVTSVLSQVNKDYAPASTQYTYNPEKAKQLIAESGIENPEISFLADTNCWAYKFLNYIIEDLENVGFSCIILDTEFRWHDLDKKLEKIDWDICMSTLERSMHGANADFLLHYMYYQNEYLSTRTGYADLTGNRWEEIKGLLDMSVAATGKAQQDIYNEIFNIVAEEAVYYPFLRRHQVTAYDASKVTGFTPLSTGGMYCLGTSMK